MNLDNLYKILEGQPKYRVQQAQDVIFKKLASNWSEATNLSKELKEKLNKECPLEIDGEVIRSINDTVEDKNDVNNSSESLQDDHQGDNKDNIEKAEVNGVESPEDDSQASEGVSEEQSSVSGMAAALKRMRKLSHINPINIVEWWQ